MESVWVPFRWRLGGREAPPECLRPLIQEFLCVEGHYPEFLGELVLWSSPVRNFQKEGMPIASFHFAMDRMKGQVTIPSEAVRLYTRPFRSAGRSGSRLILNDNVLSNLLKSAPFFLHPEVSETRDALFRAVQAPKLDIGEDGNIQLKQYRFGLGVLRRFSSGKRESWDWEVLKAEFVAVSEHFAALERGARESVPA